MNSKKVKINYKPEVSISFLEDDFEPEVIKKRILKESQLAIYLRAKYKYKWRVIFAVRIAIALVSAVIALLLYIGIDSLLTHYQISFLMFSPF